MQVELLSFQGAAQCVFELQGAHRLGLHLGGEEAEGIAPIQLGAVHGHVGRLGQRVEVVSVLRKQRNAHRRGHRELVVVDLVRLARRLLQFASDPGCAPRICSGQKQDELITAQARDRVFVAHHGAQPFGDFHQQYIAHPMAERVVHMLEVIQIQEDDGQGRLVVLCQPNGLLRAFCQQGPVGQSRECVVVGQPVNALLVGLAVIDFAVQVGHGFAQLARAVLHLSLQLLMGLGQHRLCAFAVGDVHGDPDGALGWVRRIDAFAADFTDDRGAVLAAQLHFALVRLPRHQRGVTAVTHFLPRGIAGIPAAGRTAHEFARLKA